MVKINEKELKEIFEGIRNKNQTSFEKLYRKYNKLVYGIAFSILKNSQDAEDIVQIVFEKICHIDKSKLPTDKEASWLYTTTKNEAITLFRKRNNHLELEYTYEIEDENNEISEIISQDSYNRLISKLNDKEKEIVSLKILANLSFNEISNLLNEPIGTIKWRYYKSIHNLRLLLSNLGMFAVTFIIGMKTLLSNKKSNQEVSEDEAVLEDNSANKLESAVQESFREDFFNTTDKIEGTEEIKIEESNINYIGIGILSISVIILFTTIILILFTKIHLKRKDGRK